MDASISPSDPEQSDGFASTLRNYANERLTQLLSPIGQPKLLSVSNALADPLRHVMDAADLKKWGFSRWHRLESTVPLPMSVHRPSAPPAGDVDAVILPTLTVVFLVPPTEAGVSAVAAKVKAAVSAPCPKKFIVAFVPRETDEMQALLTYRLGDVAAHLHGSVSLQTVRCPIRLFPFDNDIFSMELSDQYSDFHSADNFVTTQLASEAILAFQKLACEGLIPRLWSVGSSSKFLANQLLRFRKELQQQLSPGISAALELVAASATSAAERNGPGTPDPLECDVLADLNLTAAFDETANDAGDAPVQVQVSREYGSLHTSRFSKEVGDLIIFDRRSDLVSPFCTPLSYEALLDLHFDIPHCVLNRTTNSGEADGNKSSQAAPSALEAPTVTTSILHSNDELYREIRGLPQDQVGAALHRHAWDVQNTYKAKEEAASSLTELSDFMQVFRQKHQKHNSVALHVSLLSEINENLKSETVRDVLTLEDEAMAAGATNAVQNSIKEIPDLFVPPEETYRLLAILTSIHGGLPPAFYAEIRKLVVDVYGLGELQRMRRLELGGVVCPLLENQSNSAGENLPPSNFLGNQLTPESAIARWKYLREALALMVPDGGNAPLSAVLCGTAAALLGPYNYTAPDISTVYGGYAPLSVRIVQMLVNNAARTDAPATVSVMSPVLDRLWGPVFHIKQIPFPTLETASATDATRNVVAVFFLGGCTFAEIAALRQLSRLMVPVQRFIILTTNIFNYRTFLKTFI